MHAWPCHIVSKLLPTTLMHGSFTFLNSELNIPETCLSAINNNSNHPYNSSLSHN